MAVYLLQTLVSKPSYDSQVTFAVTSRSASATASGSIAVTDSVASQFGELLQSNPVRTAAAAEMGLNAFPGTCSVDVPENTNILILTITAPTPELAFRAALAVMDCYEAYADFILASAVLNPINGPTLPSQPSAQASREPPAQAGRPHRRVGHDRSPAASRRLAGDGADRPRRARSARYEAARHPAP